MASDMYDMPFVKLLAASDRPTREKALKSLQIYLTSGRAFTQVELLKMWKGLFFCIYHTSNPLPQQRLSHSLAALLLALPPTVFIPFLSAFFQTIIAQWSSIPSLRLDKYLYLIRLYVANSFVYLSRQKWDQALIDAWLALLTGEVDGEKQEGMGVMDPKDVKVGDGLRYHVLDVWVDCLVGVEDWQIGMEKRILSPVEGLMSGSVNKTLKERARKVVEDQRLDANFTNGAGDVEESRSTSEDDEFEGFD